MKPVQYVQAYASHRHIQVPYEEHFVVAVGTSKTGGNCVVITVGTPSDVSNGACLSPGSGSFETTHERLYILLTDPYDEDGYKQAIDSAKSFDLDVSSLTKFNIQFFSSVRLSAAMRPAEVGSNSVNDNGACKIAPKMSPAAFVKSMIAAAKASLAKTAVAAKAPAAVAAAAKAAGNKATAAVFGSAPKAAPAAIPMGGFFPSP
ncbi:hypothetical protein HDU96_006682 [Phlyctochytrium bullatum]|nr:hypothetical protein HDU96_006682 [Phlyctochytrium bullatum]